MSRSAPAFDGGGKVNEMPGQSASCSQTKQEEVAEFSPTVTANCDKGFMTISVLTEEPFNGILHTRDTSDPRGIVKELRRSPCIAYGTGGRNTSLRISLFPTQDDALYCGVRRKVYSDGIVDERW
ncbi:hypothetical protein HPB51_023820 [Rhipicephalus microplus]|uniref:Uncharacterized protein n=1 Tax=Rhipicephalus microplus TaxID=6941 RepID=A0A9J6ECY8_RHIMP|nr:hypothetical protein HPB51_023820 [Rhipicephalus microplus]